MRKKNIHYFFHHKTIKKINLNSFDPHSVLPFRSHRQFRFYQKIAFSQDLSLRTDIHTKNWKLKFHKKFIQIVTKFILIHKTIWNVERAPYRLIFFGSWCLWCCIYSDHQNTNQKSNFPHDSFSIGDIQSHTYIEYTVTSAWLVTTMTTIKFFINLKKNRLCRWLISNDKSTIDGVGNFARYLFQIVIQCKSNLLCDICANVRSVVRKVSKSYALC